METQNFMASTEFRYSVLQVALEQFSLLPSDLSEDQIKKAREIALKKCEIQSKVLSSDEAGQVHVSDNQVQMQINNIRARFPDADAYQRELADHSLREEDFRQAIVRELLVETVLEKIALDAPDFTETDARLHYHLHIDKYQQPETREARHILVTINPDFPENTREEAERKLSTLAIRLQKKPKRFAEQAQKHSECPTAMEGGRIGRVKKGVLFPTLDAALFKMSEGEVSACLESPMGFHLLQCEKIHREGDIPVEKILPKIMQSMTERNRKMYQKTWIRDLFK